MNRSPKFTTDEMFLCNLPGVCSFGLLLPPQCRLHGFSGFDTGGTPQLSRQIRKLSTQVGLLMQFYAIAALSCKANTSYFIEVGRMLYQRPFQDAGLLRLRASVNFCYVCAIVQQVDAAFVGGLIALQIAVSVSLHCAP